MDAQHSGHSVDVTDRTQAENVRLQLAAIVDSSDDAIISKNLDGVISTWNAAAQRLFGYSEKEAVGQPITLIIPPELYDEEQEFLRRLRAGERIEHRETRRITRDGRYIDVSVTISPVRDVEGTIIGFSKILRDVTESKRAQERLRESERRLHAALQESETRLWLAISSGDIGFWDWDVIHGVVTWSPELWTIYGVEPGTVRTYQDFRSRVHPDDLAVVESEYDAAIRNHGQFYYEFRIVRPSGEVRWI